MNMRRRVAVAATAAVAASTLLAAPAEAATRTFTDPKGDVAHPMDIEWVKVHNARRLVVTLKHRNITAGEQRGGSSGVYIDVDRGNGNRPTYLIAGGVGTDYSFFIMRDWTRSLSTPKCRYRETLDYDRNLTRFSISRGCLNGASFEATEVRVSAIANVSSRRNDWTPGFHRWSPWIPRD